MKPEDMKELSSTNKSTAPIPSTASMIKGANPSSANVPANSFSKEMAKQKEADIGNSVSKMLDDVEDAKLEQDDMETGVEEEEWVSQKLCVWISSGGENISMLHLKCVVKSFSKSRAAAKHSKLLWSTKVI